jgi:phenylacetic acid degradation operon negative regulatory protein
MTLTTRPSLGPSSRVTDVLTRIERPIRAWSMIITVFGDMVSVRGGTLWLGTLLDIMGALGIEAGVVRTALSRLVADGWLVRDRAGRNSFYALTPFGQSEVERAGPWIYTPERVAPAEGWTLVHIAEKSAADRSRVAGGLRRSGAGQIANNLFVWSGQAHEVPSDILADPSTLVFRVPCDDHERDCHIAAQAWPLAAVAFGYQQFTSSFLPVLTEQEATPGLDIDALALRLLMIHELRRVVLRDPNLPHRVLGDSWPAANARRMAARVWQAFASPSERWLDAHGRMRDGLLPSPIPEFRRRFKGK